MLKIILFLLIISYSIFPFPTKPGYIQKTYTSSDGLAHNIVSSISQDKKGFLWIGTYGGLNRYDGREFKTYNMAGGLIFDAVRSLLVDEDDLVWVGTELGLSIIKEGEVLPFDSYPFLKRLKGRDIRAIKQLGKSEYFIGTTNGLYFIKEGKIKKVKGFKGLNVTSIYILDNSNIIVGTKESGIFILNDKFFPTNYPIDDEVISIEGNKDKKEVLISYKNRGLLLLELSGNKLIKKQHNYKKYIPENNRYLICNSKKYENYLFLSQKKDSFFWEDNHYNRYDTENGNYCFIDREGTTWIGTYGSGILKYFKRKVKSYTLEDGLPDQSIRYIFKDSSGILWLGTQNNVTYYQNNSFKKLSASQGKSIYRARAIIEDSKKRVWFGTGSGLFYKDGVVREIKNRKNESMNIYSLDEFGDSLFLLVGGKNIVRVNLKSLHLEKNVRFERAKEPEVFWKIHRSQDKKNLFLQSSRRVLKFDSESQKFVTFIDTKNIKELNKIQVFSAISEKHYVLGYDKLLIYKNGITTILTKKDGLPDSQMVSIFPLNENEFWIGTSKGLVHLENLKVSSFTMSDGLAGDFCHFNSIFADEENVYVGSSEGLSLLELQNIIKNSLNPNVYFTKILTNKGREITEFNELEFNYDENSLTLHAASLSLISPEKNKYQFKKESEKGKTTFPFSESGEFTFYHLSPGKYRFNILGTNNEGLHSDNTDTIELRIIPAFWQTWYFQGLLIFSILALGYGIYSFRVYRIKKENAKLDALVKKRTKELFEEKEVSEKLLLNILPKNIASRLKDGESNIADSFPSVSVLFADIVGFTKLSQTVSPEELVERLNDLFSRFDSISLKLKVEKIKTIGDCYMAVSGLPERQDNHAELMIEFAIKMVDAINEFNQKFAMNLSIRVGINTGEVVAGVIGKHKFIYDLWGDAVNTASRMESHGNPGKIHVSKSTYEMLKLKYEFESRGEIEVKGKGKMETYFYKGKI
ncbi:MAG: hypothetical protein KDK36_19690 [Leptospiraceae bacterium]|nr:hypothetical protein [Leptospiraceae bacterium]